MWWERGDQAGAQLWRGGTCWRCAGGAFLRMKQPPLLPVMAFLNTSFQMRVVVWGYGRFHSTFKAFTYWIEVVKLWPELVILGNEGGIQLIYRKSRKRVILYSKKKRKSGPEAQKTGVRRSASAFALTLTWFWLNVLGMVALTNGSSLRYFKGLSSDCICMVCSQSFIFMGDKRI